MISPISKILGRLSGVRHATIGLALAAAMIFPMIYPVIHGIAAGPCPELLGRATYLTVFGFDNTDINLSNATVTGNVGVTTGGSLEVMSPSTVNGNVYLEPGVPLRLDGHVTGTIDHNADLSQEAADVRNLINNFTSLPPDQTYATWDSSRTITCSGSQTVIQVGSVNLSSGDHITFSGNCTFIINVTGSFQMGGDATIGASGDQSRAYINLLGTGTAMTHVGNFIYGTVLTLNRDITFHGMFGKIFSGGDRVTLMSGARLVDTCTMTPTPSPTPTVTPTPGTITLEVLPCEHPGDTPRVRFVGDLTRLTFFLNGQEVFPDANGIVPVAPGHYHWEVFRAIQRIAEGDVDVIDCAVGQTPTPTPTLTPPPFTPTPTPPEVPEPGTIILMGTGLMALGGALRKRFRRRSEEEADDWTI